MYVLDTNVVSEIRKSSPDSQVLAWFREHRVLELYLSAITVFEIEMGVRRIERRDEFQGRRLRRWLNEDVLGAFRGRILPLDQAVAVHAASMQVPDPRPDRDCFIAAAAGVNGMTLVTRNAKDFRALGIPFINPWEA
ncbi:MAG: type II toxin-antitoxin system VapC family toxin [Propionibacteriaceae bacterium]|nr:type II toxin-antitoxin system VapC family toxin [Propionibacteriaceae bacterium]